MENETILMAFWHKNRRCFLPLTFDDLKNRLKWTSSDDELRKHLSKMYSLVRVDKKSHWYLTNEGKQKVGEIIVRQTT